MSKLDKSFDKTLPEYEETYKLSLDFIRAYEKWKKAKSIKGKTFKHIDVEEPLALAQFRLFRSFDESE